MFQKNKPSVVFSSSGFMYRFVCGWRYADEFGVEFDNLQRSVLFLILVPDKASIDASALSLD